MVNALRAAVEAGKMESLCCRTATPRARVERHGQYVRYILHETIPFMLSENGVPSLVVHGSSIGAFHAINLALKHPSLVCKVVALSGRYDLTRNIGAFQDLFGGHYDQDILLPNPEPPSTKSARIPFPGAFAMDGNNARRRRSGPVS